jgi:integrase
VPFPVNEVTKEHLIRFLSRYEGKPWRRHGLYRALKTFFKWACLEYHFENPMAGIAAPKTPDLVLHTITPGDVGRLIEAAGNLRNKTMIALLADSGVRRSELAGIQVANVDLDRCRIKVAGKGGKEGHLIFGHGTKTLLESHIRTSKPIGYLFDLNTNGIQTMLKRLEIETGIKCNAHSFRRGFATALRRAGVGELDIQQLGRWSSLEMVRRYTKAFTFDDAAERYKPIVQ